MDGELFLAPPRLLNRLSIIHIEAVSILCGAHDFIPLHQRHPFSDPSDFVINGIRINDGHLLFSLLGGTRLFFSSLLSALRFLYQMAQF